MAGSNTISDRKRVLLIAPQPFFLNRGTPLNVKAMASCLADLGYHVDLLVFPLGQEMELSGVTVHRSLRVFGIKSVPIGPSWRKFLLDIFLGLKALRLVFTHRYAAVQGVEEGGFIAWFIGKLRGIPSVFDMDSSMVDQLRESGFVKSRLLLAIAEAMEAFCLKRSSAVITVCQALTDRVRQIAPDAALYQIEDYPLEGLVEINVASARDIANELNLRNKNVILYTGNFEHYQGLDLLLQAFAKLKGRITEPAVLLLVGGDKKRIEQYRQVAAELEIGDQVIFAGQRPNEQMGAFMGLAHVLVSPRIKGENTPLKVYSYMASGKPIVATDIRSHTQVLSSESAFLASPIVDDFAAALAAALDLSPNAVAAQRELVKNAQDLIDTKYNRGVFEEKLTSLYLQLIGPAQTENPPLAGSPAPSSLA